MATTTPLQQGYRMTTACSWMLSPLRGPFLDVYSSLHPRAKIEKDQVFFVESNGDKVRLGHTEAVGATHFRAVCRIHPTSRVKGVKAEKACTAWLPFKWCPRTCDDSLRTWLCRGHELGMGKAAHMIEGQIIRPVLHKQWEAAALQSAAH